MEGTKRAKILYSTQEYLFNVFNHIFMFLFFFICLYPFYYVVIYSVSSMQDIRQGVLLWPSRFDFSAYRRIFEQGDIYSGFIVSVARTLSSTLVVVLCSSIFAYLFTKKEMFLRKFIYRFVIITMYIEAGLIPWYIIMKTYGLRNNFLLYILPGAVNVFFVILVKTYIEQLPASLEESAQVDGAGFFTLFFRIIMPLSKPIIATIAVFGAVGAWNAWMDTYFLVTEKSLFTVQIILYNFINQAQQIANAMRTSANPGDAERFIGNITPETVTRAATVITVFPIILVYPMLQRYFVKGIMMGAIKG